MTKHFRGAVEYQSSQPSDQDRVSGLRSNFGFLNKLWIGVSFVHMAMVMLMYGESLSGLSWLINTAATMVMVLGIDLALMWLSSYIELQTSQKQDIGAFPWLAFVVSLLVELGFNIGALWSHAPPALGWLGKALAVIFGTFVALIIYVSATIQSRLDRTQEYIDRVKQAKAAKAVQQVKPAPQVTQPALDTPNEDMLIHSDAAAWYTMHQNGMSYQQIADEVGKSKSWVGQHIKAYRESIIDAEVE